MKNDLKRRGTYTLKVGDKDVNLLFNMRFWGLLDEAGYKLEKLEEHLDETKGFMHLVGVFSVILDCAGRSYAKIHGTEWDYKVDEIYDWFEEDIDKDKLEEILAAMSASKIMGHSLSQAGQGLGKKMGKSKSPKR